MRIQHKADDELFATLKPTDFGKSPRYTCSLSIQRTSRKWPDLSKLFVTQADAIFFLRQRGYNIPVGF